MVRASPLYDKDWNNFGPRVSAVYDLFGDGRTLLRAGWGLYYDASRRTFRRPDPLGHLQSRRRLQRGRRRSFSPRRCSCRESLSSRTGAPPTSGRSTRAAHAVRPELQRQPAARARAHAALQAGYVGSAGRKLFRFRAINQADPATGERPYPGFFYINQFESGASSSYNSLQASLRISSWKGLNSTLNYNWAHSIDTASDGQDYVPHAAQPDDSLEPGRERADSNFDVRHRLVWYFSWEIGNTGGKGLLSGWSLNGIVTLASGKPFNVVYLYEDDYNGSGQFFGRPDVVGNPLSATATPDRFLDLSAFQAPCSPNGEGGCAGGQHFGDLGRNAFDGPGYSNVDLSLVKNTLGERGSSSRRRLASSTTRTSQPAL